MFNLFKKKHSHSDIDYEFCASLDEKFYPEHLMKIYKNRMGYKFNLTMPQTINEIIQYLKLYDCTPIKEQLADKAKVNDYILKITNNPKLIKEVYAIYDSLSDINFKDFPSQFILKRNNASKYNLKVMKKEACTFTDLNNIIAFFMDREHINYAFANGFELQYKNIKNRYIVEKLYPNVCEWQITCTDGIPICVHCFDNDHLYFKSGFYIDFQINDNYELVNNFEQKKIVQEMIEMSKYISRGFKFVRVDFMLVNGVETLFQELTFTPFSGYTPHFITQYSSKEIGQKISYR